MKKTLTMIVALVGLALSANAAEMMTLKGKGICAKCGLGEDGGCQNVVQVKKDGKTITYYMTKNDTAKDFHKNICSGSMPITVEGIVAEKDGKMIVTAKTIKKD